MATTVESSREAAAPRPWYRLCPATWLALLLGIAVLVFVEVPGRRTSFTTYAHGWPLVYLQRDYLPALRTAPIGAAVYSGLANITRVSEDEAKAWADGMPWGIEQRMTPWSTAGGGDFKLGISIVDALLALIALVAVGWIVERRSRRRTISRRLRFFQFRLRTFLIVVTLVALVFGKIGGWYNQYRAEQQFVDGLPNRGNGYAEIVWSPPAGLPESLLKLGGAEQIFCRVQSLSLSDATDADLHRIAAMPALSELGIAGSGVTADGIKQLARLPRLRHLDLDATGIDESALAELNHLGSLEELGLTNVNSRLLHLEGLNQLRSIDFRSQTIAVFGGAPPPSPVQAPNPADAPAVGDRGPEIRLNDLPNLKCINVYGGTFSDRGLHDIERLDGLETLTLAPANCDGLQRFTLEHGPNLRTLELTIPGAKQLALRTLPRLESLTVSSTDTGDQLESVVIERLASLRELNLSGINHLSAIRLTQMPKLFTVDLAQNTSLTKVELDGLSSIRTLLLPAINRNLPIGAFGPTSTIPEQQIPRLVFHLDADVGATRPAPLELRGLAGLENLVLLDLSGRQLDKAELAGMSRLTRLEELDLSGTWLADSEIASLKPLTKLQMLNLSGTDISAGGLRNLRGMPELTDLYLENTQLDRNDPVVSELKKEHPGLIVAGLEMGPSSGELVAAAEDVRQGKSTAIVLHDSQWIINNDLFCLADLANLEALDLSSAQVTDIGLRRFEKLANLKALDLQGTHISDDGLVLLKPLRSLKTLSLGGTRISGAGLAHLQQLPELTSLDLSDCRLTDDGLAQLEKLPNLRRLDLSGTDITDAGLVHLANLTQLRMLDVSRTKITDAGLSRLGPFKELRSLNLSEDSISDAGLVHLQQFGRLEILRLYKCPVTGPGLDDLRSLGHLAELDLSATPLAMAGFPKHVTPLVQLRAIALDDVPKSVDALASLAKLPKLQELSLGNAVFSGDNDAARYVALQRLPALRVLHISFQDPTVDRINDVQDALPHVEVDWAPTGGGKDVFWPDDFYTSGDPSLGRIGGYRVRPSAPPASSGALPGNGPFSGGIGAGGTGGGAF